MAFLQRRSIRGTETDTSLGLALISSIFQIKRVGSGKTSNTGTDDRSVRFRATLRNANVALAGLHYTGLAHFNGDDWLTVEADDRGHSYNDEDDGRHHSHRRGYDDDRRDDYEDSERGEDDVFQRADGVTMQGVTDT